jgi:hypothetical protein
MKGKISEQSTGDLRDRYRWNEVKTEKLGSGVQAFRPGGEVEFQCFGRIILERTK